MMFKMKLISRALDKTMRCLDIDRKYVKVNALRRTFADNYYDHFLHSEIGVKKGYFVELGANDGIRQSYTAFLEFYFGWGGGGVEFFV